jgi:hypothetical protein
MSKNNSYLSEPPKRIVMPRNLLAAMLLLASTSFFYSCAGKTKNTSPAAVSAEDNSIIPKIDLAGLKDEPAVLDAMQKVVDARMADEKKKKENPDYSGNYLELMQLYTAVLNASTEYSKTISDPVKGVEFNNKLSAIQEKLYTK